MRVPTLWRLGGLLAAALLAGCSLVPDVDLGAAGAWELTEGQGPDGAIVPPDGHPVTIRFEDGTFGGTAACNGYGGNFELRGSDLDLGQFGATEMGCEGPVQEAEQRFFAALVDVRGVDLVTEDELVLVGPATRLVFAPVAPPPVAELTGTRWVLDGVVEGDAVASPVGDEAFLLLQPDGTVTGSTGCRTLRGEWIENGAEILFPSFGADGACAPELQRQDNQVVTVLGDGFRAEVEGQRLTLTARGDEGLTYRAP